MKKVNNQQVSEGTPKLVLENTEKNTTENSTAVNVSDIEVNLENKADSLNTSADSNLEETSSQGAPALAFVNGGLIPGAEWQESKDLIENDEDLVEIEVILPLAGKFLLPHDPPATIEINRNQANVIVEAGYGKFLTDKNSDNESE